MDAPAIISSRSSVEVGAGAPVKIRTASFNNVAVIPWVTRGVYVPDVVTMTWDRANELMFEQDLDTERFDESNDQIAEGNVIRTDPLGNVTDAALKAFVARQPISIQALRAREYPGSALTRVRTLSRGANYTRQIVSYQSDGLKIYALLTVPDGPPPAGGWPAIVFNHGYIPPAEYRTTERYVAYQDAFARNGFVTLKSDYRGHGDSEGTPGGGYNDPGYTVDVLNAATSLKKDPRVNAKRLGLWGHSMGG